MNDLSLSLSLPPSLPPFPSLSQPRPHPHLVWPVDPSQVVIEEALLERRVHHDRLQKRLIRNESAFEGGAQPFGERIAHEKVAEVVVQARPLRASLHCHLVKYWMLGDRQLRKSRRTRPSDTATGRQWELVLGLIDDDEAEAAALDDHVRLDEPVRLHQYVAAAVVHIDHTPPVHSREESAHLRIGSKREIGVAQVDEEVELGTVDEQRLQRIQHDPHHRPHAPLDEPTRAETNDVRMSSFQFECALGDLIGCLDINVEEECMDWGVECIDQPLDHRERRRPSTDPNQVGETHRVGFVPRRHA